MCCAWTSGMSSCFYAANKAHLIMLVPGLFALTLKLFSKPLSKEWYWFENVPLVTRVLKTCVHASIILKKSKNILFKIYAVCLALTGWPFYGEPYCFNIGFILFVITIVSTHLNCPAAIHWIFMRENESLPLKLVKFRRNKKKGMIFLSEFQPTATAEGCHPWYILWPSWSLTRKLQQWQWIETAVQWWNANTSAREKWHETKFCNSMCKDTKLWIYI